jgi:hypothetical protein
MAMVGLSSLSKSVGCCCIMELPDVACGMQCKFSECGRTVTDWTADTALASYSP